MTGRPLKVGMLAPISHRLPPAGYGPWEQVCHDLVEGLVALGHDVTLFAPAGSRTSAALSATVPMSLEEAAESATPHDGRVWEEHHVAAAVRDAVELELDVIHSHLHVHALGYGPVVPMPLVTTLHGAGWDPNHHLMLKAYRRQPFVSLSIAERDFLPSLRYVATVPNGIRLDDFIPAAPSENRLVFVGRMAREKAPDLALEVADAAGLPLILAGMVEDRHRDFFRTSVEPKLRDSQGEFIGPVSREEVKKLVGSSTALLMPLRWDEPFGLVVVESLAMGTPVIAWRRGAMPELIDDGQTGFLVDDVAGAVEAVDKMADIDRARCRAEAEDRFGHLTMAEGYVTAYRTAIATHGPSGAHLRQ